MATGRVERRLAAILGADVAGYSRLMGADPSASQYALRTFLRGPHPTMPNFILKPDDIDDIVGYITSLKP